MPQIQAIDDLYEALSIMARDTGLVQVTQAELEEITGVPASRISAIVSLLVAEGHLRVVPGQTAKRAGWGRAANLYVMPWYRHLHAVDSGVSA